MVNIYSLEEGMEWIAYWQVTKIAVCWVSKEEYK